MIGYKPIEAPVKTHHRVETRIINAVRTVNNSLMDEKNEEVVSSNNKSLINNSNISLNGTRDLMTYSN